MEGFELEHTESERVKKGGGGGGGVMCHLKQGLFPLDEGREKKSGRMNSE